MYVIIIFHFILQGTVLGCFFWGYMMTQVLGGYLSDRIGGEIVLPVAATVYAMIIFLTPQLAYLSPDKHITLYIIVASRVFLGLAQGIYIFDTCMSFCLLWTRLLRNFFFLFFFKE